MVRPLGTLATGIVTLLVFGAFAASPGSAHGGWRVAYADTHIPRSAGIFAGDSATRVRRIRIGRDYYGLAWSPDGRYLAYSRYAVGGVYVTSANGRELWRVWRARASSLQWSPDGRRLLFLQHGVHVVDRDGRHPVRLFRRTWMSVAWLGSTSVVCACMRNLVTSSIDGTHRTVLLRNVSPTSVSASSDGTRIAMTTTCETVAMHDVYCTLETLDGDGRDRRVVMAAVGVSGGFYLESPAWWIPATHDFLIDQWQGRAIVRIGDGAPRTVAHLEGGLAGVGADGSFAAGRPLELYAPDGAPRMRLRVPTWVEPSVFLGA